MRVRKCYIVVVAVSKLRWTREMLSSIIDLRKDHDSLQAFEARAQATWKLRRTTSLETMRLAWIGMEMASGLPISRSFSGSFVFVQSLPGLVTVAPDEAIVAPETGRGSVCSR